MAICWYATCRKGLNLLDKVVNSPNLVKLIMLGSNSPGKSWAKKVCPGKSWKSRGNQDHARVVFDQAAFDVMTE